MEIAQQRVANDILHHVDSNGSRHQVFMVDDSILHWLRFINFLVFDVAA
jgi:hypothetical protein